jgi:hypothetical protein
MKTCMLLYAYLKHISLNSPLKNTLTETHTLAEVSRRVELDTNAEIFLHIFHMIISPTQNTRQNCNVRTVDESFQGEFE